MRRVGNTQPEVARRVGTKQPEVARRVGTTQPEAEQHMTARDMVFHDRDILTAVTKHLDGRDALRLSVVNKAASQSLKGLRVKYRESAEFHNKQMQSIGRPNRVMALPRGSDDLGMGITNFEKDYPNYFVPTETGGPFQRQWDRHYKKYPMARYAGGPGGPPKLKK